jgi:hypothetical protein
MNFQLIWQGEYILKIRRIPSTVNPRNIAPCYTAVVIMSRSKIKYVLCHTDLYEIFWLNYKILQYEKTCSEKKKAQSFVPTSYVT